MTTPDEEPQERPDQGSAHADKPGAAPNEPGAEPGEPGTPAQPPRPAPRPGNYGEIAPGVPRYGQYAPEGWQPPSAMGGNGTSGTNGTNGTSGPAQGLPPAAAYPGFQGPGNNGGYRNTDFPHRGPGPVPPGAHFAAPRQVVLASRLIMIAGVLQALSGLLLLAVLFIPSARTTAIDAFKTSLPNDPAYNTLLTDNGMLTTALVIATVISLVGAAVYFWLAAKIRRGANWARITGLVLAIISLLGLTQPNYFVILQVGLGVVAMIILFRSPAKEYFAKKGNGPHGY